MTETEQLKKNRDQQFVNERMQELGKYIDALFVTLNKEYALMRSSHNMEGVILLTYFISVFSDAFNGGDISHWAFLLWVVVIMRNGLFIQSKMVRADAEIDGCFRTLKILGMMSDDDNHRRHKKAKKMMRETWAQRWERIKSKLQKEAYA